MLIDFHHLIDRKQIDWPSELERLIGHAQLDWQTDEHTRRQLVALFKDARQVITCPRVIFTLDEHGVFRIGLPQTHIAIHRERTPAGVATIYQAITQSPAAVPCPPGMRPNAVAKQVGRARDWLIEKAPILGGILKGIKVSNGAVTYIKKEKIGIEFI